VRNEVHSSHTRARGLYGRIALELLKIDAWTMKNERFRRGQTLGCAAAMALRFGKPDLAIALHDTNTRAAGTVAIVSGAALASATSIDVVLRGIGGHGAAATLGGQHPLCAGVKAQSATG
jgi:metal-dependent amidase/aminoacylase/carboxypeptidase family protein